MIGDEPEFGPSFNIQIGRARIIAERSGLYQPHPDGWPAAILAVHDQAGAIIDLVAWNPESPGRWWRRLGRAQVLGAVEIDKASHFGVPLRLVATPDEWAMMHWPSSASIWPCACVVDWQHLNPQFTFTGVEIVTDLPGVAARIHRAEAAISRRERLKITLEGEGLHNAA